MKKAFMLLCTALVMFSVTAVAQNVTVTGRITDASTGEGIPFAYVLLKNEKVGSMSDANGNYSITLPKEGILVYSSVGYHSAEVKVGTRRQIDIALSPDLELIDETVVIAYGTTTKKSFTGSAAVVSSDEIAKRVTSTVTNALAGTTPGVQVISSTGDPAAGGGAIRIRGIGSMSASSAPLYVVDGMPFDGSISDINPNDVESISVLKDASASAIYGARGANGVVLITTKKAGHGVPNVKFDAKVGSNSRLIPNYDIITEPGLYYETWYKLMYNSKLYSGSSVAQAYDYADKNLLNEKNGGLGYLVYTLPEGQNLVGHNFKLNPNATLGYDDGEYYYIPDNWYDEVFHNSLRQEYNVSISGNSGGLNYYASVGYLNDGGIISNSDYKRYTARINADYRAKSWLRFTTNLSYSYSDSQSPGSYSWGSSGNIFYIANNIAPIYPLYVRNSNTHDILTENGRTVYDSNNTNFKRAAFTGNAVRDNEYNAKHNYADVLTGKFGVVLTPVKGLDIQANLGLTNDNTRSNALYSMFGSSSADDGAASVSHSRLFTVNSQLLATYKTDFGGSRHHFDVLAGYERYNLTSQGLSGYNDHLFNPFVGELNNADGTSKLEATSSTSYYMTEGFLTRAGYDYDEKYFISGSFRRDASSRFAPGHRWGNFGSVGLAWLMSKEDFLSGADWINTLKLKASYGLQGNDNLGSYYPYADQYTHSYNEETKEYSVTLSYKGNEELTWESSHSLNAGLDFELFDSRLSGSFEIFNRITSDLLYSKEVPLSSGNPTGFVPINVGSISNKGFELVLNYDIIKTQNILWSANANLSHYKNTILSLDESVSETGIKGSTRIYKVGGSLYESYLRKYAGVNEEGKALYYKKEKDAEGKETGNIITTTDFTSADQFECGTTLPKLFGGFGSSLSAYGFDLSFQCSFQLGGKYYDGQYQALMLSQNSAGQAIHRDILNAWTPENTDTDIPRLDGDYTVGQTAVDRFMISSNYLSLDNITLGYTFPASFAKKLGLGSLRVYVTGDNLYVLSARQGVDPRFSLGIGSYTSGSGLNSNSYSAMRNVTGGVTLTF